MRFGRRAGQLIFDLMGKLRQVTERAQKIVSEKDGAVDSMRPADITETNTAVEQAIELWEQGQENKAVELMRRARLEYGPSSKLQFEYGRRALMLGQTWAAREALHDVVELDPIHLDALELFLEANYVSPGLPGVATEKVSVVAALLPYATDFDLDAASILLPSMPMVEIVDQKLRMLRYSKDPVAHHIGLLAGSSSEQWFPSNEAVPINELKAKIIIVLSRSEYKLAFRLLREAPPEAKPKRALRIAIRKELRNKQHQDARVLLGHYLSLEPNNVWANNELRQIKHAKNHLSSSQLTSVGFPFPEKSTEICYGPNNKKVFYLLHTALPHHSVGYATRTHGLLRGIRSHGWDVQGVTRLGYPYDMPEMGLLGPIESTVTVEGVPYNRLSTSEGLETKTPLQSYISRYVKALKTHASAARPFVLHAASNYWNGLAGVSAARELGIPSIYEVRGLWEITRGSRNPEWMGGPMYRYMSRMETDAANNADQVIAITNALRHELIDRGVDEDKITVVPNGVETSRFVPRPRNQALAARLGLRGKTVIGYVGSILNYEGIGLLLDAAHQLKQARDDVAFLFVGDGAELAHYRERVETEKLSDVVIFTGRVPHYEVEDYYSIIDISPFPRLPLPVCEIVSPLKPFEAMAMEKTVVASNVGALAEIVTDGETGLLFNKGDSQALSHTLRCLLDNPALRIRLAESGRRWVEQERDWAKLSEQIEEIYTALGGYKLKK